MVLSALSSKFYGHFFTLYTSLINLDHTHIYMLDKLVLKKNCQSIYTDVLKKIYALKSAQVIKLIDPHTLMLRQ